MMRAMMIGSLASLALAWAANAQTTQCGSRDVILTALTGTFGEVPKTIGLTSQGQVVETFASPTSGSWTIIVTFADGRTCLLASGQAFEWVGDQTPSRGLPT